MKISVALCTYNGARYLGEQLASIAAQTRPPDELVICDDRSADNTVALAEAFAAGAAFPVRVHVNESNLGSTENFAGAIARCTGDVIALADQDDVWAPEKLARTERVFSDDPETGLVFTDADVVDEELRPLGYRLWESVGFDLGRQEMILRGDAFPLLLRSYVVTGATMAFRSRYRELVLPIPKDTYWIHDGWIALLVSAVARVGLISEPLLRYRQHQNQQVGARRPQDEPDPAFMEEMLVARTVGRDAYLDAARRIEPVHQRLAQRGARFGEPAEAVDLASQKVAHLRARGEVPAARSRRVMHVLHELSTRRYHRFARGFYSALKDLLVR